MSDYLKSLLAQGPNQAPAIEPARDFEAIRDSMILAALNARIGADKKANLFTHYDEEGAARAGEQENLKQASYSFWVQIDRLAMLHYIAATSNTDISSVETETEQALTVAMQQWFNACNADAVFPDADNPQALATQIARNAPQAIERAMIQALRDAGIAPSPASPSRP